MPSSSSSRVDRGLTHSISKILERPFVRGGGETPGGVQSGLGEPGGFLSQGQVLLAAAQLVQLQPKCWRCHPLLVAEHRQLQQMPAATTAKMWLHDLLHPPHNHCQAHLAAPARQTSSRRAGSRYSEHQVRLLSAKYRQTRHLSREQMRQMAEATGLTTQQVRRGKDNNFWGGDRYFFLMVTSCHRSKCGSRIVVSATGELGSSRSSAHRHHHLVLQLSRQHVCHQSSLATFLTCKESRRPDGTFKLTSVTHSAFNMSLG